MLSLNLTDVERGGLARRGAGVGLIDRYQGFGEFRGESEAEIAVESESAVPPEIGLT